MSLSARRSEDDQSHVSGRQAAVHTSSATSERRPLRVLLVTDAEVIARGLAELLRHTTDRVRLLGPVAGTAVGSEVTSSGADVVLVDIDSDGAADLGHLARVIASDGNSRFVAFTSSTDERRLFEALHIGAAGYLLKSLDAIELINYLDRARVGQVVVDPALSSRLALAVSRSADQLARSRGAWPGAHLGLTLRESDVLRLLVEGLSNREIAAHLYLGQETVKTHLRSVYRKLDVQGRTQAVSRAIRDGLLD